MRGTSTMPYTSVAGLERMRLVRRLDDDPAEVVAEHDRALSTAPNTPSSGAGLRVDRVDPGGDHAHEQLGVGAHRAIDLGDLENLRSTRHGRGSRHASCSY